MRIANCLSPGHQQAAWSPVVETNIPNDQSNLNAGTLPDGRVYLVHNPVTPVSSGGDSVNGHNPSGRDPVTIATSRDGLIFDEVGVALTCTDLSSTSRCLPRFPGHAKNPGPSYPQATNRCKEWTNFCTFDQFRFAVFLHSIYRICPSALSLGRS